MRELCPQCTLEENSPLISYVTFFNLTMCPIHSILSLFSWYYVEWSSAFRDSVIFAKWIRVKYLSVSDKACISCPVLVHKHDYRPPFPTTVPTYFTGLKVLQFKWFLSYVLWVKKIFYLDKDHMVILTTRYFMLGKKLLITMHLGLFYWYCNSKSASDMINF